MRAPFRAQDAGRSFLGSVVSCIAAGLVHTAQLRILTDKVHTYYKQLAQIKACAVGN